MKNIMIVDMQQGFINKNNEHLIEKINKLLVENQFDNIFYTRFRNHNNSPFYKILKWKELMKQKEQNIILTKKVNSCIFHKSSYGLDINHIDLLKAKDVKDVYLCGTDIDACVLAIAFQLFDNGIKPYILLNLCGSSSDYDKENIRKIFERNFGADSIVFDIGK